MCRAYKIRPDLQLHQKADGRANTIEGTTHYPREIKGKIEDLMASTEKVRRTGKSGIGRRTDDNLEITERVLELFDDGLGSIDLSHAHCMQPHFLPGRLRATLPNRWAQPLR